jgi:flagellar motor switch protein FliM
MSDLDEGIEKYEAVSLTVVGVEIADGAASASLLVKDNSGKKMALQLDLQALLQTFEHVARAMHNVAHNVTGSYVHVPVNSFQVTPYEQSVCATLTFGTIGLFGMKLSDNQAKELGRKLLESAERVSPYSQTAH